MNRRQIPCGAATGHGEHCHAAGLCCACEEIARLRALVREAYEEGHAVASDYEDPTDWNTSMSKRALEQ